MNDYSMFQAHTLIFVFEINKNRYPRTLFLIFCCLKNIFCYFKSKTMTIASAKDNIDPLVNAKINGYYVLGKNNSQLVRDQLDALHFNRYDSLPMGGVKFNWITRSLDIDWKTFDSNFQILNHIHNEGQLSNKGLLLTNLRNYEINISKKQTS